MTLGKKAFASFENEIWCLNLAYVDKLAKDDSGVKYPLVKQDLFDRTVYAKGRKTKDSKEMAAEFLTLITEKNRLKKLLVDTRMEFAGEFKTIWKAEGIQIYSTLTRSWGAFAKSTIRFLKKVVHR